MNEVVLYFKALRVGSLSSFPYSHFLFGLFPLCHHVLDILKVSRLYRLLGAKIGQRVYWPGTGLGGLSGLFDLLEVGNDVTFGSRSIVMPGDAHTLETVRSCSFLSILSFI